jgi:hypothetical protein
VKREINSIAPLEALSAGLPEFLGELSYSGYQMLGYKTILLVEGSTDVRAVQQILRWWKKDHEIVLLPMGGSQIINGNAGPILTEIRRITSSVFALIDSEKSSDEAPLSGDREGFVRACGAAQIRCHVLVS